MRVGRYARLTYRLRAAHVLHTHQLLRPSYVRCTARSAGRTCGVERRTSHAVNESGHVSRTDMEVGTRLLGVRCGSGLFCTSRCAESLSAVDRPQHSAKCRYVCECTFKTSVSTLTAFHYTCRQTTCAERGLAVRRRRCGLWSVLNTLCHSVRPSSALSVKWTSFGQSRLHLIRPFIDRAGLHRARPSDVRRTNTYSELVRRTNCRT